MKSYLNPWFFMLMMLGMLAVPTGGQERKPDNQDEGNHENK